jgi:hypothetical protein
MKTSHHEINLAKIAAHIVQDRPDGRVGRCGRSISPDLIHHRHKKAERTRLRFLKWLAKDQPEDLYHIFTGARGRRRRII